MASASACVWDWGLGIRRYCVEYVPVSLLLQCCLRCLVRRLRRNRLRPGWYITHPAPQPEDIASTSRLIRIIIIDAVMIGAQHRQIRRIRGPTSFPRHQMMHLTIIRRLITPLTRTRRMLRTGHYPLLKPRQTPHPVQPHRPNRWMHQRHIPNLSKLIRNKLPTRHPPTVGEFKLNIITLTPHNPIQLIQGHHHVGSHRRLSAPMRLIKEHLACRIQQISRINRLQRPAHLTNAQRRISNRQRMRPHLPIRQPHPNLRHPPRPQLRQPLLRHLRDTVCWGVCQADTQIPRIQLLFHPGGIGLDQTQRRHIMLVSNRSRTGLALFARKTRRPEIHPMQSSQLRSISP